MPRYYCDYCDTYLTHDSPSVRKQHNAGYKHKANVRTYYQQFEEQQTQSLIDQRIKEHLGQAQAFRQLGVGAPYNPPILGQRPPLPVFPSHGMPGNPQFAMRPPPLLPRPLPLPPGYAQHPGMPMPPMMLPSGAPSIPGSAQLPPVNVPGNTAAPSPSSVPPSMAPLPNYQANPAAPTSGGFESFNNHVSAPEANR